MLGFKLEGLNLPKKMEKSVHELTDIYYNWLYGKIYKERDLDIDYSSFQLVTYYEKK